MNERARKKPSNESDSSSEKVQKYTSVVLAASTLLLVIFFAASLFIPATRPSAPVSQGGGAPQTTTGADAAKAVAEENSVIRVISGNPLLASIIVVVLTFLIIERVRDINSRITELDKGLRDSNGKIQKSVEDATEGQVKRLNERLDNLKGKIDGFERRYPWLQTINESGLVINVNSSVAILETVAGLISSQQRAAAYEWLAGASKDDEIEGLPIDFLAIAAVCRLFFNDRVLAERFIGRAESSSKFSTAWRVAKLLHLLETGQYGQASSLVLDIEGRLLPGLRMRLRNALDAKHRRQPKVITPELIAALHNYYTIIGDGYGLERIYPNLLKKVPQATITLADEIRKGLFNIEKVQLEDINYWQNRVASPLTGILLAEAQIYRTVMGQSPNWAQAYAIVEFAHRATGNQAFAKALTACVKELERANKALSEIPRPKNPATSLDDEPDLISPTEPAANLQRERADPDPFGLGRRRDPDGSVKDPEVPPTA